MKIKISILAVIMISIMSCNSEKKLISAVTSNVITEKYWKLKTLEGKDVTMAENQTREIFFTLKIKDNKVKGFAGCNNFGGDFTLEKDKSIHFENILSTLMACPNVDVNESQFFKIFELADNYTINDDILTLNIGERAPLAVFEAVYMD